MGEGECGVVCGVYARADAAESEKDGQCRHCHYWYEEKWGVKCGLKWGFYGLKCGFYGLKCGFCEHFK